MVQSNNNNLQRLLYSSLFMLRLYMIISLHFIGKCAADKVENMILSNGQVMQYDMVTMVTVFYSHLI